MTHDIDIVITIPTALLNKVYSLFPMDEFYIPPIEVLKNEISRENRGHCNIIHNESGFKADLYFAGNNDFQHLALKKVKEINFYGDKIPIAPPEYVIIKKLEFFKEGKAQKHINDIKAILQNSDDLIDSEFLMKYISIFALEKEWKLCE
ncbi:MAG: hypothetical protein V3V16_07895 [Melioribacteraceae bacterium]